MNPSTDLRKPWQRNPWVQVLAILLGYVAAWIMAIISQAGGQGITLQGVLTYTTVGAAILIVFILLLLRFLCGEKPRELNLKPGAWWQDVLGGVALGALTLLTKILLDPTINRLVPRSSASESGLGGLFGGLAQNPWLLALFLGPALMIGAATFEELSRVFFITRWWRISSAASWRWMGIVLSAILFGLSHLYQGPAGVVSVTLEGLILALWYMRSGRIFPLIISHYLYDAVQIVQVVILIRQGVIVM